MESGSFLVIVIINIIITSYSFIICEGYTCAIEFGGILILCVVSTGDQTQVGRCLFLLPHLTNLLLLV